MNRSMIDRSRHRLIVDRLTSISLRTLRSVRLGPVAGPGLLRPSLQSWTALQKAVEGKDVAAVLRALSKPVTSG